MGDTFTTVWGIVDTSLLARRKDAIIPPPRMNPPRSAQGSENAVQSAAQKEHIPDGPGVGPPSNAPSVPDYGKGSGRSIVYRMCAILLPDPVNVVFFSRHLKKYCADCGACLDFLVTIGKLIGSM